MSFRQAVAVITRRELRERLRDRGFYISMAISVVIIAAIIVLPALLGGGDDPKATVVSADPAGQQVADAAVRADDRFSVRLTAERADSEAAAVQRVRDGDADVAVVEGGRRLVVAPDAEDGAVNAVQAASASTRALATLDRQGVPGDDARAALAPPALPQTEVGDDDDAAKGVAYLALILLFGQLVGLGAWLAAGVVEEKASRIIEIVLSAVSARAILAGKILGIGVAGLLQVVVVGVVGVVAAAATDNVDIGGSGIVGALLIVIAWFVLGYALYACFFAAAGSLVSRQEDVQQVTTPATIVLFAGFFLSFSAIDSPDGTLAVVLSLLPPTAPLTMPVRMITGEASVLEVVVAVVLLLGAAALLVVAAARIYTNAVLQTGGRVRLAAALRG